MLHLASLWQIFVAKSNNSNIGYFLSIGIILLITIPIAQVL